MKWLIIIFLIPTLLFSQIPSKEDDEYDFSYMLEEMENDENFVDTYDLKGMINYFIEDCRKHSIPIPNKMTIDATLTELAKGTIAHALGMEDDSIIHIEIDPDQWHKSSIEKRWYILYHELGHDFLNLRHGEGGKMMYNIIERNYTWYDFVRDKETMFKIVKREPYSYEY